MLRAIAAALITVSLAVLLVAAGLWAWSGSSNSLGAGLQLVAIVLPNNQSLVIEEANGSLREGGSVGRLLWKSGALEVEARGIDAAWVTSAWVDGQLRIPNQCYSGLLTDHHLPHLLVQLSL